MSNTETLGSARGRGKKLLAERDYASDTDRTRSASPPGSVYNTTIKKSTPNMRINTLLNEDTSVVTPAPKGPGRGNWRRNPNGRSKAAAAIQDASSPTGGAPGATPSGPAGPHGFYLPLNGTEPSHKRTRPLTQHQLAVEQYRRQRVRVILDRGIRVEWRAATKHRRKDSSFVRAWVRCKALEGNRTGGYDTDEESLMQAVQQQDIEVGAKDPPPGFAGLVPMDQSAEAFNDHGEEAYHRAKMLARVLRRMERWEGGRDAVRTKSWGKDDVRPSGGWDASNGVERTAGGARVGMEDRDDDEQGYADEDEEMADVDEEGDRDRDEDMESEDGDDEDGEDGRHVLPPLSSLTKVE